MKKTMLFLLIILVAIAYSISFGKTNIVILHYKITPLFLTYCAMGLAAVSLSFLFIVFRSKEFDLIQHELLTLAVSFAACLLLGRFLIGLSAHPIWWIINVISSFVLTIIALALSFYEGNSPSRYFNFTKMLSLRIR
jgi:hypothetical protein